METTVSRTGRNRAVTGGGTDGNEILTGLTGAVLFALLGAIGVTIARIGQLTWLHLFLGVLLIGPALLKLASTGYRFGRYYTGDAAYVAAGPPWMPLRLIAPIVVFSTIAVLGTGLVLLLEGQAAREPWLLWHKVAFIVWIVVTAAHVAGHIPEMGRLLRIRSELVNLPTLRTDLQPGAHSEPFATGVVSGPGGIGRWLALAASLVAGAALALALLSQFGDWTGVHAVIHHG